MDAFSERENQFETKYAHDAELRFKVQARRNRLLGEWAASQMGIAGDAVAAYAKDVVRADFEKPGDDDVLQKVKLDLDGKGIEITPAALRAKMEELLAVAKQQVMSE